MGKVPSKGIERCKRMEGLEKCRSSPNAQLRRTRIYCPEHGWSKIPLLPPLACPCCDGEWGLPDMLRRPKQKVGNRKRQKSDNNFYLEKYRTD